ncbi:rod-binding protein [Mesorhizobium sp. SP-1A]|uniref:rod-binding protein n=1 Tax=Mesorhizobium sp. SP-1A TaxID=3077840 RepID=UPI0028F6FD85|nr:rod-binding protein [Mesorhizobium sp. SP-1A]
MAISPPSDIVLDVARAAGPTDLEAARTALAKRSGEASATFSVDAAPIGRHTGKLEAGKVQVGKVEADQGADKFKRFEAMVLQTFIQNMLPKDTEQVYGQGLAGDMWKSQLAERLADVMAERGGIGIARSMLADHYVDGKRKVPIGPVSGGPEQTSMGEQHRLSASLVQETQRRIVRSLDGEQAPTDTASKV